MKLDLTSALDIGKALKNERLKNQVHRVGVELEGGWAKLPSERVNIQRDGSVVFEAFIPDLNHVGELPSPPLEVQGFPAWMKMYYPKYVNSSCGMHVHMSFKNALTYSRLMTASYPATIVVYMERWAKEQNLPKKHPLWERLLGKNMYCQHMFYADEQVKPTQKDHDRNRKGHRYTVINYCYSRVSTLECRLLPMMDTCEQSVDAVQRVVNITNAYLLTNRKREQRLSKKVEVDEEMTIESRRSYV